MQQVKSANTHELQSLQILRGVAAILVVAHHASLDFDDRSVFGQISVGAIGVDIFFPISGMVIYLTASRLEWHAFLIRRIMRIAPMYWLATSAKVLAALVVPAGLTAYAFDGWHLIASLLFLPAPDAGGRPFPPIALGWTLNFEMYFYLLSTVILATLRAYFGLALMLTIGAGTAVGALLSEPSPTILVLLHPITIEFAMGVMIGFLWTSGVRTPWWPTSMMFVGAILLISGSPDVETFDPFRVLKWGIPAALIIWSMLMLEETAFVRRFPAGKLLGDASYSIYLTHPLLLPVLAPVIKYMIGPAYGTAFFLLFACSVFAGLIVHLLVERRLNRYIRPKVDAIESRLQRRLRQRSRRIQRPDGINAPSEILGESRTDR